MWDSNGVMSRTWCSTSNTLNFMAWASVKNEAARRQLALSVQYSVLIPLQGTSRRPQWVACGEAGDAACCCCCRRFGCQSSLCCHPLPSLHHSNISAGWYGELIMVGVQYHETRYHADSDMPWRSLLGSRVFQEFCRGTNTFNHMRNNRMPHSREDRDR